MGHGVDSINSNNVAELRQVGQRVLEMEERYHPTSSYWYAPASGAAFTAVEGIKIGLERAGHPNIANAIGTLNGGPGVIGLTVDLFRATEFKDKPYVPPDSSTASRLILAGTAGTMLGLGMVPDPRLRYAFAGTAALRRSFIETLGYAFDGDMSVNPHTAMIASGLVALGRSAIPYWGNPPPTTGEKGGDRFLNGMTDTAGEVGWEFGASILAVGLQQIADGRETDDFWIYPKRRILPSLVPAALRNIYAQPIRPNAERLAETREAARHAGFNLDQVFGERVQFRNTSWSSPTGTANAGVLLFLDFRPSITFEPEDFNHLLWAAPRFAFQQAWNERDYMDLNFYESAIHEGLHLGASYGFYAQGPDGEFRLYGGEGPILHHLKYIFGSAGKPHHERPGEQVENEWSRGFGMEARD